MKGFKRLLSMSSLTQLADELVSAKIILPWVFLARFLPLGQNQHRVTNKV